MESNTKDRELFITRTLNAPVELVWEVWTNPEHIANWWGPNGFTNTISKMDVVPGGQWNLVMHGPDGTDYVNKSTFKEVIEFKRISYEHFNPHFVATINFEAQGEQTLLTWRMLFDSEEILQTIVKAHNAAEGLKQNVEKLSMYLANQLTK
ncbi:SRPBCC family protein [Mucilaginibacter sp. UYCu711]|uniref:SRPBCC family protein n=1 Tax=Mucilaginibacter sp. UYCu711 TaxID=3156339 RepID=UPI003D20600E